MKKVYASPRARAHTRVLVILDNTPKACDELRVAAACMFSIRQRARIEDAQERVDFAIGHLCCSETSCAGPPTRSLPATHGQSKFVCWDHDEVHKFFLSRRAEAARDCHDRQRKATSCLARQFAAASEDECRQRRDSLHVRRRRSCDRRSQDGALRLAEDERV